MQGMSLVWLARVLVKKNLIYVVIDSCLYRLLLFFLSKDLFMTCNAINSDSAESEKSKETIQAEINNLSKALEAKLKVAHLHDVYLPFQSTLVEFLRGVSVPKASIEAIMSKSFEALADAANAIVATPAVMKERHQALEARIPILVITGFLGSGKTTLLNYILTAKHGHRIAVCVHLLLL